MIKTDELRNDKNLYNYLRKLYTKQYNQNLMFSNFNVILSKNILKSRIYNKLHKMI